MNYSGLLTFRDAANREIDVHYHNVESYAKMTSFADQIAPWTHSTITHCAFTQGDQQSDAPASEGEFDSVAIYLKIFMTNLATGDTFYDFLPAPVNGILENQREGKRMIQEIGEMYAGYVSTLKQNQPITFRHAYVVGYKY